MLRKHTPINYVLDLGCGAGGMSLGFKRAGFIPVGIDTNKCAVDYYRHNVGIAQVFDIFSFASKRFVTAVISDVPTNTNLVAWIKRVYDVASMSDAPFVLINMSSRIQRASTTDDLRRIARGCKYTFDFRRLNALKFGVPQYRTLHVVVSMRRYLKKHWSWPTSFSKPLRVCDVTNIPYKAPSPRILSSEEKSSFIREAGTQRKYRRASEQIGFSLGESWWRDFNGRVALFPDVVARLNGVVGWTWGRTITELRIASTLFPPSVSYLFAEKFKNTLKNVDLPFISANSVCVSM